MSDDLSDHQWHVVSLTGTAHTARASLDGRFQGFVSGMAITPEWLHAAIGNPFDDEVDDV